MTLFPVPLRNDFGPDPCVVCGQAAGWIVFEEMKMCRLHLRLLGEAISTQLLMQWRGVP